MAFFAGCASMTTTHFDSKHQARDMPAGAPYNRHPEESCLCQPLRIIEDAGYLSFGAFKFGFPLLFRRRKLRYEGILALLSGTTV